MGEKQENISLTEAKFHQEVTKRKAHHIVWYAMGKDKTKDEHRDIWEVRFNFN
jgi:hypothetical protein